MRFVWAAVVEEIYCVDFSITTSADPGHFDRSLFPAIRDLDPTLALQRGVESAHCRIER